MDDARKGFVTWTSVVSGAPLPLTSDNAIGPLRAPQVSGRRPLARPPATRRARTPRQPTNSRQQEPQIKQHQEEQPKTRPTTKTNQDTTTRAMTTKQDQDPQTKPTNKSPNRAGIRMPSSWGCPVSPSKSTSRSTESLGGSDGEASRIGGAPLASVWRAFRGLKPHGSGWREPGGPRPSSGADTLGR